MSVAIYPPTSPATRERAILIICACAALAFGAFASLGSPDLIGMVGAIVFFTTLAFILPLSWGALVLAGLIPLQIYFPFIGSLNMRGVLVFVFAATARVLLRRIAARNYWRWQTWVVPAVIFLLAALIAAVTAENRYGALKGIYDWLPVFASAFVVSEIAFSKKMLNASVIILIAGGIAQAALGLIETLLCLPRVFAALQSPLAPIFFQPNLLRERLVDFSFNWVLDNRVVPFGTFINGIDFAIYLATILCLVLALLLDARSRRAIIAWLICATILGLALVQTFKGSGLIALACGALVIIAQYLPRLSRQTWALIGILAICGMIVAAFYSDALVQRVSFLIERELGVGTAAGRIAIWAHVIEQLPQRPLFGFGLNNGASLVPVLASMTGGAFAFNIPGIESAYVSALIETGLVGFIGLIGWLIVPLGRAFVRARSGNPIYIGILAAMIAILAGNVTVASLTTDQNGILLGALIGLVFAKEI